MDTIDIRGVDLSFRLPGEGFSGSQAAWLEAIPVTGGAPHRTQVEASVARTIGLEDASIESSMS